jgi:hypothetical protein
LQEGQLSGRDVDEAIVWQNSLLDLCQSSR